MICKPTTEELLSSSLKELAKNRPLDKITVKEIANNCGMSSATFYNHFQDKYALIAWIYNHQMEQLFDDFTKKRKNWKQTIKGFLDVLDEDKSFFMNALKNTEGQNSFYCSTHLHSIDLLIKTIKNNYPNVDDEVIFDIKFYLRAMSNSIVTWYLGMDDYSREALINYMYNAIPEKLKAYLK